jgi:hypothetical protein
LNARLFVAAAVVVCATVRLAHASDKSAGAALAEDDLPPSDDPDAHPKRAVGFSLAPIAAVRFVDNLSIYSGGVAFTLGGRGTWSAHLNARANFGETPNGLPSLGLSLMATAERRFDCGLRVGGGGGVALFSLFPVTSGFAILSVGPATLVRIGYDFGFPRGVFTTLDLEGQIQGRLFETVAVVWGPTFQVGYRF